MRWLLIDEVLGVERGKRARSRSRVPAEEVSPELLMVEMMAQTGALLLGAENDFQEDVVFAKIENASFDHPMVAGEPIDIEARSEGLRPEGAWLDGAVRQNGKTVGQARFLLMNVGHLIPGRKDPITFHRAFMNHFKIREKIQ